MDEALFGAALVSVISFTTRGMESSTKTLETGILLFALEDH